MMDMLLPVAVFAGLFGFFAGLVVLIRWLRRAVHRAFEGFARVRGLTYTDHPRTPSCAGEIDGRTVRVANEVVAVPWGVKSRPVPMFVVSVQIHGAPQRLWLGKLPLQNPVQPPRQQVSVLTVDPFAYVVTEDAEAARVWLSRARADALKATLDRFCRAGAIELDSVFVEEGSLVFRASHMQKASPAWIGQQVDELIAHARALEAPGA